MEPEPQCLLLYIDPAPWAARHSKPLLDSGNPVNAGRAVPVAAAWLRELWVPGWTLAGFSFRRDLMFTPELPIETVLVMPGPRR
jgi:hypothetical protein